MLYCKLKLLLWFAITVNCMSVFAQNIPSKIEASWQVIDAEKGKENPTSKLVLYNNSEKVTSCSDWSLWFNFMRSINIESVSEGYKIAHKNGDLYQLSFLKGQTILPKKSIEIAFKTNGTLPNFTDAPAGLYFVYHNAQLPPLAIGDAVVVKKEEIDSDKLDLFNQYNLNMLSEKVTPQLVIPQPSFMQQNNGSFSLTNGAVLYTDSLFEKEAIYLKQFLSTNCGFALITTQNKTTKAEIRVVQSPQLEAEEYLLSITHSGIDIISGTSKGAFYAIQTLKSLFNPKSWAKNVNKIELPFVEIKDKPRFGYRGLMLDVARNFQSKESVFRIIDLMAMYKLNTLHLHLNDDEGWRIEIPSIPELIEVGSKRSATYTNGKSLQPSYGSGATVELKSYYTVNDFVEILQYAAQHYINVIPELETPGHARAAIKSMQARYEKYMAMGNKKEAEKFLLNDFADQSEYLSAQNWTDNVMNVAMPSVYTFIATVIDDLKSIYDMAGLSLTRMHLGGDEVPRGAWEKSPKITSMMNSLNMSSVYEVWPYYIEKIANLCNSKGINIAGWEEMGMVNKGKGMNVNPELSKKEIQLDVWNNLVGGGQEDLAYRLANAGYKVVYTSASNMYFDLAWANNFNEPGHSWAGFIDIKKSYSFLPTNYFINMVNNVGDESSKPAFFNEKIKLTAEGKTNLIGVKGAIWTEKIRSQERLEYMLLPRLIVLAEKAWAPEPAWEQGLKFDAKAFERSYSAFMQKLGGQELHKIEKLNEGYKYRLPTIGIKILSGMLFCNTEYPGYDIFYTTDQSEPTLTSKKYNRAIRVKDNSTYKFKIISQQGRSGNTVTLKL